LLRALAISLVVLLIGANSVSLGLLIRALLLSDIQQGRLLLLGALQVWITNIIVFGLAYWELDRGGAVTRSNRRREDLPPADFRFSQDEDADAIEEVAARSSQRSGWRPQFIDYLYISVTNSTAFSPTDTMPLTARAKILMSVQAIAAIVVNVLVIARAVSILK
jgi:hypothetical protein